MTDLSKILHHCFAQGTPAILVRIVKAQGSTPRDGDAAMIVTATSAHGTIGGGQLEFHASEVARAMLASPTRIPQKLDLPLGPHLGQCCGGRVLLSLEPATQAMLPMLEAAEAEAAARRPHVLIFGAGHTGRALADALALLPLATCLIDDRADTLLTAPAQIATRHLEDPADAIAAAPAGTAFVIVTHSHALDYRLAQAALARADAAYVGMIGSQTKRARFESWYRASGGTSDSLARFTCPIGGRLHDKRPEVIAALTTAELLHSFAGKLSIAKKRNGGGRRDDIG